MLGVLGIYRSSPVEQWSARSPLSWPPRRPITTLLNLHLVPVPPRSLSFGSIGAAFYLSSLLYRLQCSFAGRLPNPRLQTPATVRSDKRVTPISHTRYTLATIVLRRTVSGRFG